MPIDFKKPQYFKEFRFCAGLVWAGINAILHTVSGASPLSLTNALAKNIVSLMQYGKCTQASAPTPSSPVDIVCNNGKLGVISEGVPIEYIRIEYLQSSGTQYIDTGIAINYANQKIEQRATVQYTTSNANRELMGSNGYGFWGKSAENKLESATGSNVPITESALVKNTVSLITNPNNNNQVTFIVNSNRYDSSASTLADNNYTCYLFALGGRSGAAASFFCHAKVYEYTIILDDVMVSHLIPVKRRSDGVLGMYDTVTNSFKTNAGTGTFTAGNAIGSLGVVGTPEVLSITAEDEYEGDIVTLNSPSLMNVAEMSVDIEPVQDLHGYDAPWPAGGGKNKFDSSLMANAVEATKYITLNLKPNTEYTMSSDDPCKDNGIYVDLFLCNVDESPNSKTNGVKLNQPVTKTSDANGQLRVWYRRYKTWITPEELIAFHTQVEEGSTATAWIPYSNICPISGHSSVNVIVSPTLDPLDGTTYPIPLGQTVYGGTDDVIGGNGSDEWTKLKLLSSFSWQMDGTTGNDKRFGFLYASTPSVIKAINQNNTYISNVLAPISIGYNSHDFGTFYISNSWLVVHDKNSHFETLADFKEWLDSEDVYLVYKVATPTTFTHTPTQVELLHGENNLWSDAGAIYVLVKRAAKQTASVANLFAVGDYKDEQDIISGLVTHKVGIKVLDGTENWELHSNISGTYRLDGVFTDLAQNAPILSSLLCTHFSATNTLATADFTSGMARWAATTDGSVAVYTSGTRLYACFGMSTVQEVKAFLAAQCTAGTPVIVVYPLAQETTENVTPQPLSTAKGDNTITVDAEVDDINLEVEYYTTG